MMIVVEEDDNDQIQQEERNKINSRWQYKKLQGPCKKFVDANVDIINYYLIHDLNLEGYKDEHNLGKT